MTDKTDCHWKLNFVSKLHKMTYVAQKLPEVKKINDVTWKWHLQFGSRVELTLTVRLPAIFFGIVHIVDVDFDDSEIKACLSTGRWLTTADQRTDKYKTKSFFIFCSWNSKNDCVYLLNINWFHISCNKHGFSWGISHFASRIGILHHTIYVHSVLFFIFLAVDGSGNSSYFHGRPLF